MSDSKKQRKLIYRRAAWINDDFTIPLQVYVEKAHTVLDTIEKRTFQHGPMEMQGLRFKQIENTGIFLHVASYFPKAPTSIVPDPSPSHHADVNTSAPPKGNNYMEGDIMFLVSGNDLILCPCGVRENIAREYLRNVLKKVGFETESMSFGLEKVANCDKVKLLKSEGVKSISLGASLYDASIDYLERKTIKSKILSGVVDNLQALFQNDNDIDLRSLHDKENLTVRLEISFDQRKKGGAIGRRRIERTADKLVHDREDEGFTIETFSGKKVTAKEINLSQRVNLEPLGKSVMVNDAWAKIKDYFLELKQNGMLEQ